MPCGPGKKAANDTYTDNRGARCASVVIGRNQKSDKPNQLKISNNDISVSRDITDEEFQEILATFKSVREALPK